MGAERIYREAVSCLARTMCKSGRKDECAASGSGGKVEEGCSRDASSGARQVMRMSSESVALGDEFLLF